jgi:hypothetical protein
MYTPTRKDEAIVTTRSNNIHENVFRKDAVMEDWADERSGTLWVAQVMT